MHEVINTMSHIVIAGMRGNAGAGGAILALAADQVFARPSVVLNPHYRSMGELYGSEYWTYLLPKRVGQEKALELTQGCQPLGARKACEIGFLDEVFGEDVEMFEKELRLRAMELAQEPDYAARLVKKLQRRLDDELAKPLASYRDEELQWMRANFFGPDPAYHEARRRFVFKGAPPKVGTTSLIRRDQLEGGAIEGMQEAAYRPEFQPNWAVEQERRSLTMAQAWANLLRLTIRRLFATAQ